MNMGVNINYWLCMDWDNHQLIVVISYAFWKIKKNLRDMRVRVNKVNVMWASNIEDVVKNHTLEEPVMLGKTVAATDNDK